MKTSHCVLIGSVAFLAGLALGYYWPFGSTTGTTSA